MNKLPEVLKKLRKLKNLSQDELSSQLGISRSAVSMYERGEREPDIKTMHKITDFYGVTIDFLLGNTDIVACPVCGFGDNPLSEQSRKEHDEFHKRFTTLKNKYPFLTNYSDSETMKHIAICQLLNDYDSATATFRRQVVDLSKPTDAVDAYIKADFSLECQRNSYNDIVNYEDFYLSELTKHYNSGEITMEDFMELGGGATYTKQNANELNSRDKRDIAKDVISIMEKLEDNEDGPLRYNGEKIDDESLKLFRNAIELGLTQLKSENKVLYNPHKNDNKE